MADIEDLLISQLGCCKHNPASRVGPTPSPTCHTGQGGSRKGMRPLRQRNGSHEIVNPPRETGGGFFIWSGAPTRPGDLVPACQPVQIAELTKSETCHDRNYRSSSACRRAGITDVLRQRNKRA